MRLGSLSGEIYPGEPMRFDEFLSQFSSEELKRLAKPFVGTEAYRLKKDAALRAILTALQSPDVLRRRAASLSEGERFALTLVRRRGGSLPAAELAGAICGSGHTVEGSQYDRDSWTSALNGLTDRLLLMNVGPYTGGYGYSSYSLDGGLGGVVSFSDERLLPLVEHTPPKTLAIEPAPQPEVRASRRPAEVLLLMTAVMEAIGRMGGLPLTKNGKLSRPGLHRLTKALKGREESPHPLAVSLSFDEFLASEFLTELLGSSALLSCDVEAMRVLPGPGAWEWLEAPFEMQALQWAMGYQVLTGWAEFLPRHYYDRRELDVSGKVNALRAALLTGLAALPDPARWYRFSELAAALEGRLKGKLSLMVIPSTYFYGRTEAERQAFETKRQEELRKNWVQSEQVWLERALRGPLFHLGLVELGAAAESPDDLLFRLTDPAASGLRFFFHNVQIQVAPPPSGGCWVVQPNLDVVVYMDRVTPARLAFLGQVAKTESVQPNAATYRLTRDSVYYALESGFSAEQLLEGLREGSQGPLSPVVERTLRDWSAKRERIRLHTSARLLEFPDTAARDAAAERLGKAGAPVGERFLRLEAETLPRELAARVTQRIDYRLPPPTCLEVAEDGTVTARGSLDLPARSLLLRWMEPLPDRANAWRLTEASVRGAAAAGLSPASLETVLTERTASGEIPGILRVAVRAWASGRPLEKATLGEATLFLIQEKALAEAVEASERLRALLGEQLSPRAYLVPDANLDALRALLAELGIQPKEPVPRAPRSRKKGA